MKPTKPIVPPMKIRPLLEEQGLTYTAIASGGSLTVPKEAAE